MGRHFGEPTQNACGRIIGALEPKRWDCKKHTRRTKTNITLIKTHTSHTSTHIYYLRETTRETNNACSFAWRPSGLQPTKVSLSLGQTSSTPAPSPSPSVRRIWTQKFDSAQLRLDDSHAPTKYKHQQVHKGKCKPSCVIHAGPELHRVMHFGPELYHTGRMATRV